MSILESARNEALGRLPANVRAALDDPVALAKALAELTEEERQEVLKVIEELVRLGVQYPPSEGPPPIPEDSEAASVDLVALDLTYTPHTSPFQTSGATEIVPPPDVQAQTERGEGNGVLYPVWYLTTREPVQPADPSRGFKGERNPNGEEVHRGVARVFVPETHAFGSLGSSFLKRWLWLWSDDRLQLRQLEPRGKEAFWEEIKGVLKDLDERADLDGVKGQVLLYVHGYNVSFAAAVVRAAQLGYDLRVPGLTACFSWPSKGTYRGYPADAAAVEASVPALVDFMAGLVSAAGGAGRVHVLAHSMGNRATLRALQQLVWQSQDRGIRLGQILLAAPDVDRDVFRLLAPNCLMATDLQTNMYTSHRDRAVRLSRWLYDYPRAGFRPPTTVVRGIHTIDVTRIDLSWDGHSYYGTGPVLDDVRQLIHDNTPPEKRRLRQSTDGGLPYYYID